MEMACAVRRRSSSSCGWSSRSKSIDFFTARVKHGSAAGLDDPVVEGEHDGGGAVSQAELGEDVADVALHRGLAHEQLGRDLGVAGAAADEAEDVELASGQLLDARRRFGRGRTAVAVG